MKIDGTSNVKPNNKNRTTQDQISNNKMLDGYNNDGNTFKVKRNKNHTYKDVKLKKNQTCKTIR